MPMKLNEINELKHSISVLFVSAMDRVGTGEMTLDEFDLLVGLTAKVGPDDERQRAFYDAVKELAEKVAKNR